MMKHGADQPEPLLPLPIFSDPSILYMSFHHDPMGMGSYVTSVFVLFGTLIQIKILSEFPLYLVQIPRLFLILEVVHTTGTVTVEYGFWIFTLCKVSYIFHP